jgi:hypothetical protein
MNQMQSELVAPTISMRVEIAFEAANKLVVYKMNAKSNVRGVVIFIGHLHE